MRPVLVVILLSLPGSAGADEGNDGTAYVATGATLSAVAGLAGTVSLGFLLGSAGCPSSGDCSSASGFYGGIFGGVALVSGVIGLPLLTKGLRRRDAWRAEHPDQPAERGSKARSAGIAMLVLSSGAGWATMGLMARSYQRSERLEYLWKDEGAAGWATAAVGVVTLGLGIGFLAGGNRVKTWFAAAPTAGGAALQLSGTF